MEIKIGKWYKDSDNGAVFVEFFDNDEYAFGYGFAYSESEFDSETFLSGHGMKKASRKHVEKLLSREAERLGFEGEFIFSKKANILTCCKDNKFSVVFDNGKWADVPKVEDDGDEYPRCVITRDVVLGLYHGIVFWETKNGQIRSQATLGFSSREAAVAVSTDMLKIVKQKQDADV